MILLFLLFVVAIVMVLGAVNIGIVSAWFLHMPFMYGWHQAWHHWPILLLYCFLVLPFLGLRRS